MQNSPTTQLLGRIRAGDSAARGEFLELIYDELRRLAAGYMSQERREHTLQPTALVHEAFVKLVDGSPEALESRPQFFRTAARAMRQVLVDYARWRGRAKRDAARVELDDALAAYEDRSIDLLTLAEGLGELEETDPYLARIVEMRFFAGMETAEIAELEEKSERTLRRDLQFARGWLRKRLESDDESQ